MWTRTEPLVKYGVDQVVDWPLLEDERVLTSVVERLKWAFTCGLEDAHLVVHGEVRYEQDESGLAQYDQVRLVLWAMTYRDPVWIESILADARQAVLEDQAWYASPVS